MTSLSDLRLIGKFFKLRQKQSQKKPNYDDNNKLKIERRSIFIIVNQTIKKEGMTLILA